MVLLNPLVSNVPPPALRVMARVLARLKLVPNCSVPPLKVSAPVLAPRLPSDEIDRVPWLMLQGVTCVVVPVSVQVEVPVFTKLAKPWYCAAAPILETSKLALVAPPSRNVP